LQRGRGGGLAGALGGMGGQSAFGTKAGDLFTKITVGVAAFWIVLCILANNLLGRQQSLISSDLGGAVPQATVPMTPAQPMTQPGGPAVPTAPGAGGAAPGVVPAAPQATPDAATSAPASAQPSASPAAEKPSAEKPSEQPPAAEKPAVEKPAVEKPASPEQPPAPAK
jgi:preprotein translocase subunit SecG